MNTKGLCKNCGKKTPLRSSNKNRPLVYCNAACRSEAAEKRAIENSKGHRHLDGVIADCWLAWSNNAKLMQAFICSSDLNGLLRVKL